MSFFSDLSSAFNGGGWGGLAGDVIQGIGTIAGGLGAEGANTQGANTVANAIQKSVPVYNSYAQQGRDAFSSGANSGIAALDSGLASSNENYDALTGPGATGTSYLQGVVARNPYFMTPEDTIARNDLITNENNGLATSGLRGSGRAVAGVMNDTLNRFDAGVAGRNMAASQGAAGTLNGNNVTGNIAQAGNTSGVARSTAGIDVGVGQNASNSLAQQGNFDATAGVSAAQDLGQSQINNGQIGGQTLGTLGSIIANGQKQNQLQRNAPSSTNPGG